MDWSRDGLTWPHRDRSQFVRVDDQPWHVQLWPHAQPQHSAIVLIHGTGSSTHSWRDVAALLASRYTVVAVDLPGHGFSARTRPGDGSLEGMARGALALLRQLQIHTLFAVGHSAGAAIAAQMALDAPDRVQAVMGLNPALMPLQGWAAHVFSPTARLLSAHPMMASIVSWQAAQPWMVQRLLESTGSHLDAQGVALYRRLVADTDHVAGVLEMTARWDLSSLLSRLPQLQQPVTLVTTAHDRTVPPTSAQSALQLLPQAKLLALPQGGHLAHEEDPQAFAHRIDQWIQSLTTQAGKVSEEI